MTGGCLRHLIKLHELADLSGCKGETPHRRSPTWLPYQQGSSREDSPEEAPIWVHPSEGLVDDDKADDTQHPPVRLLLRWKWPLLSEGGQHHLIYVG